MTDRFKKALDYVLANEGPYSNDPRDPGGATKFGIILTEYQEHLGRPLTPEDVKHMELSTAQEIYLKKFWAPIQGDAYAHDSIATAIFDTAVNKGLGGCMVVLTDALHDHFATRYGADVQAAIAKFNAGTFLAHFEPAVERYIEARIQRYPNMIWAKHGWMNRAKRLLNLPH